MKDKVGLGVVGLFAVLFLTSLVSAVGTVNVIEIDGIDVVPGSAVEISGNYRDTVPVRVEFTVDAPEEEARVEMWFSGSRVNAAVSERFDILVGPIYSKTLLVPFPDDFDDDVT